MIIVAKDGRDLSHQLFHLPALQHVLRENTCLESRSDTFHLLGTIQRPKRTEVKATEREAL